MSFIITIVCVALVSNAFGYKSLARFNDKSKNPCSVDSGVYFFPDPDNKAGYIQCDNSGNAYPQVCGDQLVWDDKIKGCNWATLVTDDSTDVETTEETETTTTEPSVVSPCELSPCVHGECIESSPSPSSGLRRYACICEDDWFGRRCDKRIDDSCTCSEAKTHSTSSKSKSNSKSPKPASNGKKGYHKSQKKSDKLFKTYSRI